MCKARWGGQIQFVNTTIDVWESLPETCGSSMQSYLTFSACFCRSFGPSINKSILRMFFMFWIFTTDWNYKNIRSTRSEVESWRIFFKTSSNLECCSEILNQEITLYLHIYTYFYGTLYFRMDYVFAYVFYRKFPNC